MTDDGQNSEGTPRAHEMFCAWNCSAVPEHLHGWINLSAVVGPFPSHDCN